MSGNAKFRWFFLAPIVVALLVVASPASAKEFLIADVYFDDGSVLHNAKFLNYNPLTDHLEKIKAKHENEIFTLNYEDLKTLEFVVKPEGNYKEEATVTLKIKTKTGVVINDQFSTADEDAELRGNFFCGIRHLKFVSKVTGKEVLKYYRITNLGWTMSAGRGGTNCKFEKQKTKAISAIEFKDDILAPAKDITPPSIDIAPPSIDIASFITVKKETPVISGRVSDDSKVAHVTVEGRQTDLKKNGVFSFKRYVPSGESSIRIVAIDEWGNKSQKDVRIKRIVTAKIPTPKKPPSGSGFFVSKMGHVITNAHVVKDCNRVTVGDNANKQVSAEVVNTDGSNAFFFQPFISLQLLKFFNLFLLIKETGSICQTGIPSQEKHHFAALLPPCSCY